MEEAHNNIHFYKESLRKAENETKHQVETGKALKDIVGVAYENHRKRIWNYFEFDVSKDKHDAMFHVDWSITYQGKLVALEECKGHYLDSCFMERALTGFCKTVNAYQKKGKNIPLLIIHSFTRYKRFNEKLLEDMETRKPEISNEIRNKLKYTTLVNCDRLPNKKWFSTDVYNCYSANADDDLIAKDIKFIRSLIPDSG